MNKIAQHTGRVLLACTAVAGIGLAIAAAAPEKVDAEKKAESKSFAPGAEEPGLDFVQSSYADIVATSLADRTSTQKFAASLENLGHEPPRVYDMNGNTVYFSTRQADGKKPAELLQEYQHEFVVQGLNKTQHLEPLNLFDLTDMITGEGKNESALEFVDAAGYGEIMPYQVEDDYMSMGGAEYDYASKSPSESPELIAAKTKELDAFSDSFMVAYATCGKDVAALEKEIEAASDSMLPDGVDPSKLEVEQKLELAGKTETKGSCSNNGLCSEDMDAYMKAVRRQKVIETKIDEELLSCPEIDALVTKGHDSMFEEYQNRVTAMRQIEAYYDEKSDSSIVTAVWTDEDFDLALASADSIPDSAAPRSQLERCEGCDRTFAFHGNGQENGYSTDMMVSKKGPDEVVREYKQRMSAKGWDMTTEYKAPDGNSKNLQGGQWLQMTRGTEQMMLHVQYDAQKRETRLTAMRSD